MPEDDLTQNSDTTELPDSQNNEDSAQDEDDGYDPNADPDPDIDPNEDDDPPEADPTQVEAVAAPVRPSYQPRNIEEHMQLLSDKVDPDVLNSIFAVMNANYANARGGEAIADHYIGQIDTVAPGFITANERAYIRNMSPQQQADPGAIVFGVFSRAINKASQSGNTVEAIDEICADWMKRRGKPVQRTAAPVLPPSQRVGTSGGGGGTVTRPAASSGRGLPANKGGSTNFLRDYVGLTDREAQKLTREL